MSKKTGSGYHITTSSKKTRGAAMINTANIYIRIDGDILDKIRDDASKEYRTIAKQINYILKKHYKGGEK